MAEGLTGAVEMFHLLQNQFGTSVLKEILVCVLILLLIAWKVKPAKKNSKKLPPGPYSLPIVGYLPFLGKEPYKVLHNLRKKYGNIFGLYIGRSYTVILGDYDAVKEAFSKSTTLDRPPMAFDFVPDRENHQITKKQDQLTGDVKITSLQGHFPVKTKGFEQVLDLFQ
ncbi:cytochrome P450 2J5 [Trichonephila clavipes]|nr:cytochrome P450 2J5 [Trichonephila clavipes]